MYIKVKMASLRETLEAAISNQLPVLSVEDVQALLKKLLEAVESIEDLPYVEPSDLQPPLKKATAKRFVAYLQTKYGELVPPKPVMKSSQPSPLALQDYCGPTKLPMNSPKIPPKTFPKPKAQIPSPHESPRFVRPLRNHPASEPISDTRFQSVSEDTCDNLDKINKKVSVAICVTAPKMEEEVSASAEIRNLNSKTSKDTMRDDKQESSRKVTQRKELSTVQLEHLSGTVASTFRTQALRVKRRPRILHPSHLTNQAPDSDLDSSAAATTKDNAVLESIPIYMALELREHRLEPAEEIHGGPKSFQNEGTGRGILPPQVFSPEPSGSRNDSNNAGDAEDSMCHTLPQYMSRAEYKSSSIVPKMVHVETEATSGNEMTSINEEGIYSQVYESVLLQPKSNTSYVNDDEDDDDVCSSDEFDSDAFSDEDSRDGMQMDECSPAEKQAMKATKRKHIATELLTTEQAYVKRLHIIDQEFHLKTVIENRTHHMFPDDVIPQMFSNINSIYQLHKDILLPQLEERMADWDNIPKIGDLMSKFAPFLKLYSEYVKNFDHASKTINKWQQHSTKFTELLAELQRKPECGKLSLQHHMLEPIQRVPRYEMLLKDYLKYLDEDSEDRPDTEKALGLVTTSATNANKSIVTPVRLWSLLELNQMFRWRCGYAVDLTDVPRQLIKEGQIFKVSARNGALFPRYLFMFTDMLLVCTDRRKLGMYHVHNLLKVDTMQVLEGDNTETPFTFYVETHSKTVELHSSTEEEKLEWFSTIQSVIKGRPRSEQSRKTDNRLGHRAPRWVKDQNTSICMLCAATFSIIKRRHHCRCCGLVACGECSSHKVPLPYQDNKPDRVCGICYEALKLQTHHLQVKASDPSVVCGMMLMSFDKTIWERRWFALHEDFVLYSFNSPQDTQALTSTSLPGYMVSEATREDHIDKEHVIKISHPDNTVLMYINSPDSWIKWLIALQRAVFEELPPNYISKKKDIDDYFMVNMAAPLI